MSHSLLKPLLAVIVVSGFLNSSLTAQDGVGYRFGFGRQTPGGDLGSVLNAGTEAEFSVLKPLGPLRIGAGANWVSLTTAAGGESWSQVGFHGLVGYVMPVGDRLRPYVEGRYVFRRLRPEDDRFFGGGDKLLRDFVSQGTGFEGVAGVEVGVSERVSVDLSVGRSAFDLSPDLSAEGLGAIDSGNSWRVNLGVSWFPMRNRIRFDDDGNIIRSPGAEPVVTDAWGQEANFGQAVAEAWFGNFLPWVFNETVPSRRELKISQLSPRSWWNNIDEGWKWDDNAFSVNLFAHPIQGNMYFNAARSNGYGYWTALAFATAGSFNWECCGETHLMSINDWGNTSLGGAAVGEVLYRTSSMVLDNRATGFERKLREAAAFLLNPTRGFARIVSGNAGRVYDNPVDPRDYRPEHGGARFEMGMRGGSSERKARGGELPQDLPAHGFISAEITSGSIAELERRTPFDWFQVQADVNFIRGRLISGLRIQGNLWHRDLSSNDEVTTKLVLVQDFEYENNSAFEQGGQGLSLMYYRRQAISERNALAIEAAPSLTIMGGVKSEFAVFAEVDGIRERYRRYDFGWGPGFRLGLEFERDNDVVLEGSWRGQYLSTLNGANFDGYSANHFVQTLRLRGLIPVSFAGFSLGADYERFQRRSVTELDDLGLVRQNANLWRVFLRWRP